MNEIPGDLKFMKSHEWARVEGDGFAINTGSVAFGLPLNEFGSDLCVRSKEF